MRYSDSLMLTDQIRGPGFQILTKAQGFHPEFWDTKRGVQFFIAKECVENVLSAAWKYCNLSGNQSSRLNLEISNLWRWTAVAEVPTRTTSRTSKRSRREVPTLRMV